MRVLITKVEDEPSAEGCESEPGTLKRRKQRLRSEDAPQWTKRGLFKAGFFSHSPRTRGTKKFTK